MMVTFSTYLIGGPFGMIAMLLTALICLIILNVLIAQTEVVKPVNPSNKNRLIDSFADEECWHDLRFRKEGLRELLRACNFPHTIVCDNKYTCPGESAFCMMLYRIAYPRRLFDMQDKFGREYTQLSRIFKASIKFMYDHHKKKVIF